MYLLKRVLRKSQMAFDFSGTHTETHTREGHDRHLASGAVVHVAPTHATVHVANGDLHPGQKIMFKPHGAPRKRQGTIIGRDTDGSWHIEGARQGHQYTPERHTLPRENIWTMEEHEVQKRRTSGTHEATSAHGRTISVEEMRRRKDVGQRNLGIAESEIWSNPRILQTARATLAALASRNGLDPRFTISNSSIRNDDPEAMTLYSEYATAALTNLRGLAASAPPEEIQAFRDYLAGEEVPSRIAYNIHRSGKTAAIRYLRQQQEEHLRDREYSTTGEDDAETGMREISATTAHVPYHESELAQKVAMERAIEKHLTKMDAFDADLIRRKFALGDYVEEQSNEQIAQDLGGSWNRISVGQAVKKAMLKFARSEGATALRGFLKSVKEHVERKTICIDFDGVIADYSQGYQGEDIFGTPMPGAAESLHNLKRNGWKIIIFTTRPNTHGLRDYLRRNGIWFDEINENSDQPDGSNPGKPIADIYLDDRAVRFINWPTAVEDIDRITYGKQALQKALRVVPDEMAGLIKSHIRQYTKKDGTVVQEHDDKRTRKHVDLLRHENSHKEDIHSGAELTHGQELVDHLKQKGWKHKEVSAARRNKDLSEGKKEDIPEPSKIKGANQQNPALVSAQRVLNRLHEAAKDADDPVAALLAVSTSRANPYLKAVDDERTKLLKHFGYDVNHDEKHDKFDKDGHTIIISKNGDKHKVEFAGGDDNGKEQLQSVRGRSERESFDGGKKEAKFVYGDENTAYTGKMNKIQTKFAVVDADTLTTSHNYDGHVNQAYPQEIQPRDRARIASRMQIQNIAGDIKPELYGISHLTSDGAPIVGPDGIVESGNGRTLALNLAYHTGKADHYKEWLKDYARHVGIDSAEIDKLKRPMLVRVRQTDVDRPEFAREANQSNMMQNSPVEQAFSDAERISDTMLAKYKPGEDGDVLSEENRPFIQEFLGTLGANERASLIDKQGDPNKRCVERVQAAVFARVYKSEVLTELMTESADNDVKNIIGAMSVSAADYAKIQKHGDLDVTSELLDAIDIFRTAKRSGSSIDDQLDQAGFDMQGNTTTVDPTTEALSRGIHEFKGSRKKLTALFKIITQKAGEEIDGREHDATYGASDMFGNTREKKGKKQIVSESVAQARRGEQADAGQDDLFRASSYPAGLFLLRKSTGRTNHGNEGRDTEGKAPDGAGCHRAGARDEGRLAKAEEGKEEAGRPNGDGREEGPRRGTGALKLLKSHVKGYVRKTGERVSAYDKSILPGHRRKHYDIIHHILTRTPAKDGAGSFHVSEFGKKYSHEDTVEALSWMREIDGRKNVDFSATAGLHSLSLQKQDRTPYTLGDFHNSLNNYYGVEEASKVGEPIIVHSTAATNNAKGLEIALKLQPLNVPDLYDSDKVTLQEAIERGWRYYSQEMMGQHLSSPAFNGAEVACTQMGFDHLTGKHERALSDDNIKRRLKLLPKVRATIITTPFVDNVRTEKDGTEKYGLLGRFTDGTVIRVAVQEEKHQGKVFVTVYDWEDVSKKIKRASQSTPLSNGAVKAVDMAPPASVQDNITKSIVFHKSKNGITYSYKKPAPQRDAAPMLLKAHVTAYQRTTASGAVAYVREHEDNRVRKYGNKLYFASTHADLHAARQGRFGHLPNWGELSEHDRNRILDAEEETYHRLKENDAVRDHVKAKERERQKEAMRSGGKVATKDLVASGLADKSPGREVQLNMFKGKRIAGIRLLKVKE